MTKNKEYKAEYMKDYKQPEFNPEPVPGINVPQINQNISIEI